MPRQRLAIALSAFVGGCAPVVLSPAGDVARQQGQIVLISTGLMLLIIVPVMALTVWFAWRYRAANRAATYDPSFTHSAGLELVIWSAPLAIVTALGALTWISTHLLDPYRPIGRIDRGKPLSKGTPPLEIGVVAMDWKWLFIYPEQGIATVNWLALPVDRQVRFRITSTSVMNSFYVPALAGMIYAMPGMETKLHAVLNREGRYRGMSANYSGAGFSGMRFPVVGYSDADFARWSAARRGAGGTLDRATYLRLERPSENVAPAGFRTVEAGLFERVVNMCVAPGATCMAETMRHDGGPRINDTDSAPGHPKGALLKDNDEKGVAPHSTQPRDPSPPGKAAPRSGGNRDMTWRPRREDPARA